MKRRITKQGLRMLPAVLIMFAIPLSVAAQPESVETAPPPISVMSKAEQESLDKAQDVGDRTKLALKLMDSRAAGAENALANQNYDAMYRELGAFHALMENSLDYLNKRNTGRGKVLDNFKRFEIGLRKFMPRLETIRRELPIRYEEYVRTLVIRIRDARTKATEPLFGETVLRPQSRLNQ